MTKVPSSPVPSHSHGPIPQTAPKTNNVVNHSVYPPDMRNQGYVVAANVLNDFAPHVESIGKSLSKLTGLAGICGSILSVGVTSYSLYNQLAAPDPDENIASRSLRYLGTITAGTLGSVSIYAASVIIPQATANTVAMGIRQLANAIDVLSYNE